MVRVAVPEATGSPHKPKELRLEPLKLPHQQQAMRQVTIPVLVPEGYRAGQIVDFTYGSLQLEAPVPPGVWPGETFCVEWRVGEEAFLQEQVLQKLKRWEAAEDPWMYKYFMWNMLQAWHLEQLQEAEWRPHPIKGTRGYLERASLPQHQQFRCLRAQRLGIGSFGAPEEQTGDERAFVPDERSYKFVKFEPNGSTSDYTKELPKWVQRGDFRSVSQLLKDGKPWWPSEHFAKIEALKRVRGLSLKASLFSVDESCEATHLNRGLLREMEDAR